MTEHATVTVLRRAARQVRDDLLPIDTDQLRTFTVAIADWFDHTAGLIEANGTIAGTQSSILALVAARAYLGEVST